MAYTVGDALLRAARPQFLLLTPACLALGIANAHAGGAPLPPLDVLLVLAVGLSAHVGVNALNEYADFRSGLDLTTRRTPFSGGSGALPSHPAAAVGVLRLGLSMVGCTVLLGLYFVYRIGWPIALLGLLGIAIVVGYTPWINRSTWLCLIAPGAAFGPLMVIGSDWVLRGAFSTDALWLSLVPFFLVNNLLLLNQFPDVEADRRAGRRHLPIRHGPNFSARVHASFVAAAALSVVGCVVGGVLAPTGLVALLPLTAGAAAAHGALRWGRQTERLLPYLALNVAAALLTPLSLAAVLLFG